MIPRKAGEIKEDNMELVCNLLDYYGDVEDLICIIDPQKEQVCWPKRADASVSVRSLLEGRLMAIYTYKEVPYEPERV